MKIRLLLLFIVVYFTSFTQDKIKIDSLLIRLGNETVDTNKIKVLQDLSSIYSKQDLYQALNYSKQALDIAIKNGNKKLIANSYALVASNLIFIGIYDESLMYFIEALRIAEETKNESLLFSIYHNIGVLKDRLQQYDEALDYYFKALGILDTKGNKDGFVEFQNQYPIIYNNIGNIYGTKKDTKSAKEYYSKAFALINDKKSDIFGIVCNNLGKNGIEQCDYDSAYYYLKLSLESRTKNNDQQGIAKTYAFLALYYKETRHFQQAIEFANSALEIGKQLKSMPIEENVYLLLSEIYYEQELFKKSLEYFKLYKDYNDSLLNDKKYSEIAKLQFQYKSEIEEKENQVKQQKVRFIFVLVSSILFLVLIILGLLFILSKNRNRRILLEKEKLEDEMMIKNKELTTNVMYLLRKNELIDSISKRLLSLKARLTDDNKQSLQKIIFDLQSITDKEVWEEFELRFQSVHEDFYKNLKVKFPDLTPSEIKLAAFLRLNMTSKDIASITGQSVNSLENARYRLRKKLGITNQEINLVNFLLEI